MLPVQSTIIQRNSRRDACRRSGLSLIEVLVVLGMIAVLMALLLPAVQMARGAALRMSCTSNLRQIGIAIANYESTYTYYPPSNFRWRILPYVDQTAIYQASNSGGSVGGCPAIFRCPADGAQDPSEAAAGANYFGCGGSWHLTRGYDGIFTSPGFDHPVMPGAMVQPKDVRDGLSNTAMCAELLLADGSNHRLRTAWETPVSYSDLDEFVDASESIPLNPTGFGWRGVYQQFGRPWDQGTFMQSLYNHAAPPNRPSCVNGIAVPPGLWTAASQHAGGVNCLFADGRVEFTSQSVDRNVWRNLGSRTGVPFGE